MPASLICSLRAGRGAISRLRRAAVAPRSRRSLNGWFLHDGDALSHLLILFIPVLFLKASPEDSSSDGDRHDCLRLQLPCRLLHHDGGGLPDHCGLDCFVERAEVGDPNETVRIRIIKLEAVLGSGSLMAAYMGC